MHTIKASELQRQSAEVLQRVRTGETVAITHYRKPIAKVVPAETPASTGPGLDAASLPADLDQAVDAYAAEHGLGRPDALHALLRAGLTATEAPSRMSIWDLYPEAETETDLYNLIYGDDRDDGECAEYEPKGRLSGQIEYGRARGHWLFLRTEETGEKDERGFTAFRHEYIVCADKREAKKRFREAIIEQSRHWSPEHGGPMWVEFESAWNTFAGLAKAGKIPAACYDYDDELYDPAED